MDVGPTGRAIQLDSLRTFAVALVAYSHWAPGWMMYGIPFGHIGVLLFFVLSGFLITGIILDFSKDNPVFMKRFYIRRALRILPPYYLSILVLLALGAIPPSEGAAHIAYLSNVYLFIRQEWTALTSHFWSLSVEEQFYLLWPALLVLLPRAGLPALCVGVLVLGELMRTAVMTVYPNLFMIEIIPPTAFGGMAAGALLAYLGRTERGEGLYVKICGWVAPLLIFAPIALPVSYSFPILMSLMEVALIGAFVWLIDHARKGFKGPFGRFLELRPLVYVGTISYGVYLYHMFAPHILEALHTPAALRTGLVGFFVNGVLTIAMAAASWHLMEKPINSLKHRFPYRDKSLAAAEARAPAE